jgi:pimeloyl-ACP methyl ester carboxylesterase
VAGALGALILLALAAGALISWHFSSQVLVPDRSDWPEDVEVERVGARSIVLERTEDTERRGVYGLVWQGGHAIVGAVLDRAEGSVTRQLRRVRGYLVPEQEVAIDSYVFSGDPRQALGLPSSDIRIRGELGQMHAWFVPGARSARTWAIYVHGINSDPQSGLRIAPVLHELGLPQLLITYREDRGAPPSPDGYHHMGLTEWRDLEAAARYAVRHGAGRLVLVGYSMGGSLVTQFMQKSRLASRVHALLLDAPALDWKAILEFNATDMGLPGFLANPVEWAIGARIDADWHRLDALRHTDDLRLPILLFHGTDDDVVPIETSDELAADLPEWVTYHRVPDAGHTESWNVEPGLYGRRTRRFFEKALQIHRRTAETKRARPKSGSK